MSVTDELLLIAPQYLADANLNLYITSAEKQTNRCWYGANADRAVALRVAHMMTMALPGRADGSSGAIASKKEGDLSISYRNTGTSKGTSDLDQTHYGVQLQGLTKQGGAFLGVTGGNGRTLC